MGDDIYTLERARVQAEASPPADRTGRVPQIQLERDGEHLWVFGDGERHERRIQRILVSKADRTFWITLAIACGEPGFISDGQGQGSGSLAKRFGTLEKARNDLDAFHEYHRPMRIGDPFIVSADPGLLKSPGYFDRALHLDNPTVEQVRDAIRELRQWVRANQDDPEYTSFQLNFFFSGHGDLDDSGNPSIVLADAQLHARDLAHLLLAAIPETETIPAPCRLDLYLDCCHSTAVARVIIAELSESQRERDTDRSWLVPGQMHFGCLEDEEAFELDHLGHSVFTFGFLNECSRKRPEGAATTNLGLRDVGWYTGGRQHPLLLDFTDFGGINLKFPSMYHLTNAVDPELRRRAADVWARIPTIIDAEGIDGLYTVARAQRAECLDVEQELVARPDLIVPFSRDEILTNEKFPFL